MNFNKKKDIIKNLVTAIAVTLFFSCKNSLKDVQNIGVYQNAPAGIADTIDLKYTDSSRLVANLLTSKMLDYSNRDFSFSEFPNGIELIIYDENNNKTKIFSDYAIVYNETNLIDLQGNIILATHQKDSLFTPQLFYDQKKDWIFTNERFRLKSSNNDIKGRGFDSDKNFKGYEMLEMGGDIELEN